MSETETTFEEKLMAIAMLLFCFCFGYWTRSIHGVNSFIDFPVEILDGFIRIIALAVGSLVLIGMILLQFEKGDEKKND